MKRSRSGSMNATQAAIGIVVLLVVVAFGGYILGAIQGSIVTNSSSSLPSAARSAINTTFSTGWTAYGLMPILAVVVAAAAIIGVLVGVFAFRR